MMHYGHANALRQARELGDYLIVGVHSDAEITKNKGPPVMNEEERYRAVESCKWVDEVVRGAPYVTSLEMMDKYNADFCAHGDDLVTTSDGTDTYHEVKAAGRFKTFKRTEGVSTTDLVGRMLLLTKDHHKNTSGIQSFDSKQLGSLSEGTSKHSPYTGISHFLPTSRKIVQFSEGREPKPNDKIVYIDGTYDLFHVGHSDILKLAKSMGDYLLVGVHDDKTVNQIKQSNFPIMNLHERVLSVLSCKYADEVLIGAPYSVTQEMIQNLKISIVVHGSAGALVPDLDGQDPYRVPKQLGIFKTIESPTSLLTTDIIQRIIDNRLAYEARNKKKEAKELAELQQKQQEQTK